MKMKLTQLKVLLEVAVQGSFGKAAKSLGLTQPAISQTIAELEAEIGMPILVRHSRGIELNEYGQVLVRHAKNIDLALLQAREDIDDLLGSAMRQLRIGFTAAASYGPLAKSLLLFQQQYPEVKIITQQHRPRYLQRQLLQKELDIAVITLCNHVVEDGLECELLYSLGNFIIASNNHPIRHKTSLKHLLSYPWIDWDEPHQDSLLAQLCARYNLSLPQKVLHCPSPEVMQYLLEHSTMLSMWSTAGLPLLEKSQTLKKLNLKETLPITQVGIVSASMGRNSSVANQFIELLRQQTQLWLQQDDAEKFLAHHPLISDTRSP